MFKTIFDNVLQPMAVRMGTGVSGILIGYGITEQHADAIGIGVASGLLVACDLMLSWFRRRKIVNDTVKTLSLSEPSKDYPDALGPKVLGARGEAFRP